MNDPFRLAIVGADHPHGSAWRELLDNLESELTISAVLPDYGGATTSLEERFAGVPRFDTVDQLLDYGQFDGAMITLPNDVGPQVAARLAAGGKHVLLEKPVAATAAESRAVVEAVEQSGVAFQSGYMWRYDEGANRLRRMVQQGQFGKLISTEMTYVTSDVRRRGPEHYLFDPRVSGGGFFSWLACHYLDLLLYVTQRAVVGVTARCDVFGDQAIEVEDGGIAILDLEDGSVATFLGGYWLPRWAGEHHWTMRGTQRWVHWHPGPGGRLEIHGPQPQWHAMEEVFELPPDDTPGYGGSMGLQLVRDWLQAARGPRRACRNTTTSMVATLELIDAIYESSRQRRRIECRIAAA